MPVGSPFCQTGIGGELRIFHPLGAGGRTCLGKKNGLYGRAGGCRNGFTDRFDRRNRFTRPVLERTEDLLSKILKYSIFLSAKRRKSLPIAPEIRISRRFPTPLSPWWNLPRLPILKRLRGPSWRSGKRNERITSFSRTYFLGKILVSCLLLFFAACAPGRKYPVSPWEMGSPSGTRKSGSPPGTGRNTMVGTPQTARFITCTI